MASKVREKHTPYFNAVNRDSDLYNDIEMETNSQQDNSPYASIACVAESTREKNKRVLKIIVCFLLVVIFLLMVGLGGMVYLFIYMQGEMTVLRQEMTLTNAVLESFTCKKEHDNLKQDLNCTGTAANISNDNMVSIVTELITDIKAEKELQRCIPNRLTMLENNQETLTEHVSSYKQNITNAMNNVEHCQSSYFIIGKSSNSNITQVLPYIKTVAFKRPYSQPPVVTIGISYLDVAHWKNLRVEIDIIQVTNIHIKVLIRPWSDTILFDVGIRWMACPS